MARDTTPAGSPATRTVDEAFAEVRASFDRSALRVTIPVGDELMLINVSTRRFGRAVRLPEGDVPAPSGSGVSKWQPRGGS